MTKTASREISNSQRVIDSRDIIARIDYLEYLDEEPPTDDNAEERAELAALRSLAESGYSADWSYGATLIRDSYFEEYAQELAEDIGAIGKDLPWPACHIDWEAAADALKQDYTSVDFDGVEYWVR